MVNDCAGAQVVTIPNLLDTDSTYAGIAYSYLTALYSCDYMGYVRHVGPAATSIKNHMWLLELECLRQVITPPEVE